MKEIPLTHGVFAIVDDDMFDYLNQFNWSAAKSRTAFYAVRGRNPSIRMHREIMAAKAPFFVDHINGNTLDNRRENLRLCSSAQNTRNAKRYSTNSSGLKGAVWHHGKWRGKITFNYKSYHLGVFNTAEEAHQAYCEKARELHGEYARFN